MYWLIRYAAINFPAIPRGESQQGGYNFKYVEAHALDGDSQIDRGLLHVFSMPA